MYLKPLLVVFIINGYYFGINQVVIDYGENPDLAFALLCHLESYFLVLLGVLSEHFLNENYQLCQNHDSCTYGEYDGRC